VKTSFVERTAAFWRWFDKNEERLADMVKNRESYDMEEVVAAYSEGVHIISEDIHFNVGGDYEFTFAVSGRDYLFYLLPYVVSNMPEKYRGKWHFYPYMQSTRGQDFGLRMHGANIDAGKVMISLSIEENASKADIQFYCKELASLPENECYSAFYVIMETIIGEGLTRACVGNVELAKKRGLTMFPLTKLEEKLVQKLCKDGKIPDPAEQYFTYQIEPREDDMLRSDIFIGTGNFGAIINDYYAGDGECFNDFAGCGATAAFLFYSYDKESEQKEVLTQRYEIMDRLEAEVLGERGSEKIIGLMLGGAMGKQYAYIDMLLYDLQAFADKAHDVLKDYPRNFSLSEFKRNGDILISDALSEY